MDFSPTQRHLGPIALAPGVTPAQIFIFFFVICTAIVAERFANLMQPLFLTQQLHVPAAHQGVVTGMLESAKQGAILIFISFAGAVSDRVGRRIVLMSAVLGFAACFLVYPFITTVGGLLVVRFLWGGAFAGWTAGGATKMVDYPENRSRGKFIALMFVIQVGFGALFLALVGARLLGWFKAWGFTPDQSIRYGFWAVAAIPLCGAIVAFFLMDRDGAVSAQRGGASLVAGCKTIVSNMGAVFKHARQNPRFGLTLLIGLVIRTDTVIVYAFLTLWVINAARLSGVGPIDATKTAGVLLAILSAAQFITPLIFGYLADKVNRTGLLMVSLAMTTVAFLSFGLVHDVFGKMMMAAVILVGLAEGAQIVAAQSLFGQEAPETVRGAATGIFTFLGNISVLAINIVGGYLFDKSGFAAPFVMEGALHLVFFVVAGLILLQQARPLRPRPQFS